VRVIISVEGAVVAQVAQGILDPFLEVGACQGETCPVEEEHLEGSHGLDREEGIHLEGKDQEEGRQGVGILALEEGTLPVAFHPMEVEGSLDLVETASAEDPQAGQEHLHDQRIQEALVRRAAYQVAEAGLVLEEGP